VNQKVLEFAKANVKPGASKLEFTERVEAIAIKEGIKHAFPLNVSVNEMAAHFTPSINDELVFGENDLVKIDSGVHDDGYIADAAVTVDLSGENGKLVEASREALKNAISIIKDGITTKEIGKTIEETITSYGFKPIENLTGHVMDRYNLHAGISIPNISVGYAHELKEGDVVAIEPFATPGRGRVNEMKRVEIFRYLMDRPLRMKEAREMLVYIKENFSMLPFAERWLMKKFSSKFALQELVRSNALKTYPILKEMTGALVSQAEHTVIVTKDSCEVTT
jgi:methionyl aminopeptidase